jgi:H+-translocating NAD(P) transhydrogenase subunit alpha
MVCLKSFLVITLCLVGAWGLADASRGADSSPDSTPVVASAAPAATTPSQQDEDSPAHGGLTNSQVTGLIASLTIFVLAIFVGFEVITKVPPTLHTPLMSGSNAISGITLVGAVVAAGAGQGILATLLGTLAVTLATVNVVGGFLVTHRMLQMFRKK